VAVAGEVARYHVKCVRDVLLRCVCVGDRRLERAVAIAQQHRHRAGGTEALVSDGEVEIAVAGEVARHDEVWVRPHCVVDRGLEGAVAVAQEHRDFAHIGVGDGVVVGAGDGEVEVTVAVEIARHQRTTD
jgi:hypothetical protein